MVSRNKQSFSRRMLLNKVAINTSSNFLPFKHAYTLSCQFKTVSQWAVLVSRKRLIKSKTIKNC